MPILRRRNDPPPPPRSEEFTIAGFPIVLTAEGTSNDARHFSIAFKGAEENADMLSLNGRILDQLRNVYDKGRKLNFAFGNSDKIMTYPSDGSEVTFDQAAQVLRKMETQFPDLETLRSYDRLAKASQRETGELQAEAHAKREVAPYVQAVAKFMAEPEQGFVHLDAEQRGKLTEILAKVHQEQSRPR